MSAPEIKPLSTFSCNRIYATTGALIAMVFMLALFMNTKGINRLFQTEMKLKIETNAIAGMETVMNMLNSRL